MNCPSCGSPLEATAEFSVHRCRSCGHELLATYAPPVGPPARPAPEPAMPSRALARTVVLALGMTFVARVLGAAWNGFLLATRPGYLANQDYEDPDMLGFLLADAAESVVTLLLMLFTIVVFCLWIRRSYAALNTARTPGLRFTPGWAVGWWFIPFANLYKPYEVMVELWRATTPGRSDDWAFTPRSPILPLWWGLWLADSFAGNVAARLSWNAESPDASHSALAALVLSDLITLPAAALAAWLVWTLQLRLERKFAAISSLTPRSG
jgi:hypothetical protein